MENKKGSDWVPITLGGVLLIYTAYRTIELMSLTLPAGNWWIGLFALGALDGGVIGWSVYLNHHAASKAQTRIAVFMVGADLLGVGLAMAGDVFYQVSRQGWTAAHSDVTFWAIVIQVIVVFGNVVAGVVVPLLSPEAQLRRQQRLIYHDIESERLKAIGEKAQALGKELAAVEAQWWVNRQREQYAPKMEGASNPLLLNQGYTMPQPTPQQYYQPAQPQPQQYYQPAQHQQPAPAHLPAQPPAPPIQNGNVTPFPGVTLNSPTAQPSADGGSDPN